MQRIFFVAACQVFLAVRDHKAIDKLSDNRNSPRNMIKLPYHSGFTRKTVFFRLTVILAVLAALISSVFAQDTSSMSDEEKKALEKIIGEEEELKRPTGKASKSGKGGFEQSDTPDNEDADEDSESIQIQQGDVLKKREIVSKAQKHQSDAHVTKQFDQQMKRVRGKVPAEDVDLYLRYKPSPAARQDEAVRTYEKKQWDKMIADYKAKLRNSERLAKFDNELRQTAGGNKNEGQTGPTRQSSNDTSSTTKTNGGKARPGQLSGQGVKGGSAAFEQMAKSLGLAGDGSDIGESNLDGTEQTGSASGSAGTKTAGQNGAQAGHSAKNKNVSSGKSQVTRASPNQDQTGSGKGGRSDGAKGNSADNDKTMANNRNSTSSPSIKNMAARTGDGGIASTAQSSGSTSGSKGPNQTTTMRGKSGNAATKAAEGATAFNGNSSGSKSGVPSKPHNTAPKSAPSTGTANTEAASAEAKTKASSTGNAKTVAGSGSSSTSPGMGQTLAEAMGRPSGASAKTLQSQFGFQKILQNIAAVDQEAKAGQSSGRTDGGTTGNSDQQPIASKSVLENTGEQQISSIGKGSGSSDSAAAPSSSRTGEKELASLSEGDEAGEPAAENSKMESDNGTLPQNDGATTEVSEKSPPSEDGKRKVNAEKDNEGQPKIAGKPVPESTNNASQVDRHQMMIDRAKDQSKRGAAIEKYIRSMTDNEIVLSKEEQAIVGAEIEKLKTLSPKEVANLKETADGYRETVNDMPSESEMQAFADEKTDGENWSIYTFAAKMVKNAAEIVLSAGEIIPGVNKVAGGDLAAKGRTENADDPKATETGVSGRVFHTTTSTGAGKGTTNIEGELERNMSNRAARIKQEREALEKSAEYYDRLHYLAQNAELNKP